MQDFVDRFYNEKRSSAQVWSQCFGSSDSCNKAARVKQALSRKKALEKMVLLPDPSKENVRGVILRWLCWGFNDMRRMKIPFRCPSQSQEF